MATPDYHQQMMNGRFGEDDAVEIPIKSSFSPHESPTFAVSCYQSTGELCYKNPIY
jgi:hypothetical protein